MRPSLGPSASGGRGRPGSLLALVGQLSAPALAAQLIWSVQVSAMKLAVNELDPYLLGTIRVLLAGLVLLFMVGRAEPYLGLRVHHWPRMLVVGLVGMGLNTFLWQMGLALSTASNAALISSASPAWALLLAAVFGYEKLARRRLAGLSLALLGVVLVIQVDGLNLGGATLLGDLLLVGNSITWATYNVLAVPLLRVYSPMKVTAWAMVIGAAFLLVLSPLGVRNWDLTQASATAWIGFAYATVMGASIAHTLWSRAIRNLGPGAAMIHSYLMPVGAVATAAVLLGEQVTLTQIVGAAFVLGGVTLATLRRRR